MAKVKNKKSNLADSYAKRRKQQTIKKSHSPFEVHINKDKTKVLGRKSKADRGLPGIARTKAIAKRKNTLLLEYKVKDKDNIFLDRRIGEKNAGMSKEDKAMARFAAERVKAAKKKNIFNLNDEEVLTHRGQSLMEIEKYDDPRSDDDEYSDNENKTGKLDKKFVEDAHFGGGVLSKPNSEMSRKDLIDQLIAESKKRKAERQKIREETIDLTEKLDSEWHDLLPIISSANKAIEVVEQKTKADDYDIALREMKFEARGMATDKLKSEEHIAKEEKIKLEKLEQDRQARMKGFSDDADFQKQHRSADDLDDFHIEKIEDEASDEEIMDIRGILKQTNDKIEKAENDQKDIDDEDDQNDKVDEEDEEDAGNDDGDEEDEEGEKCEDDEEVEESEDEDGINIAPIDHSEIEESSDEENMDTKQNILTKDDKNDSKHSSKESDNDDDGDDNGDDDDDDDEDDDDGDDNEEEIGDDNEDEGEEEKEERNENKVGEEKNGNKVKKEEENQNNLKKEERNENEVEKDNKQIMKEKTTELTKTEEKFESAEDIEKREAIIEKARKELPYTYQAPTSYEELKKLFENRSPVYQSVIVERIIKCNHWKLLEENKEKLLNLYSYLLQYLDDCASVNSLEELVKFFQIFDRLCPHFYDLTQANPEGTKNCLRDILKEKHTQFENNIKVYPNFSTLILFKLVSILYPTSDFRHPVVTPCLVFMSQILLRCKVKRKEDISKGLFVCTLMLEYTLLSKRWSPAVINFLRGIVYVSLPKPFSKVIKVIPPFKSVGENSNILVLEANHKKSEVDPANVKMQAVDFLEGEMDDNYRIRTFTTAINLLSEFQKQCNELDSAFSIFEPIWTLLTDGSVKRYPKKVKENVKILISDLEKLKEKKLEYLMLDRKKPKALRMYEPRIEVVREGRRHKPMSKTKAEREKLLHKLKKETKSAIREVRKDTAFLAKVKIKQQLSADAERKRKVKEIFGDAAAQQNELKKFKKK